MIPDIHGKSHVLGIHNENHAKNMAYYLFFFRRFWVKELRHSGNIFDEKRHLHRSPRRVIRAILELQNATRPLASRWPGTAYENRKPRALG